VVVDEVVEDVDGEVVVVVVDEVVEDVVVVVVVCPCGAITAVYHPSLVSHG
jgi:hypothetical protein